MNTPRKLPRPSEPLGWRRIPATFGHPRAILTGIFRVMLSKQYTAANGGGLIAHPECTFLTNAASKWLYKNGHSSNGIEEGRWEEMRKAAAFYNAIKDAPVQYKAIENPIMHKHGRELVGGGATQYVQPWWFGSKKNKATGLRLYNLPKLIKTNVVGPMPKTVLKGTEEYRSWNECWYMSPGPDRGKKRARTDPAIAKAIAEQWKEYLR